MKEIKILSIKRKAELSLRNNIIIRISKILMNPLKILNKISQLLKNKKVKKINWSERSKKFGKYSVIDTQTPKEEFEHVTRIQKNILIKNLKKYLTGREKKILDFGCGTGRFSKELSKISKKHKVVAVDTEKNLIDIAIPSKNVRYLHIKDLKEIKGKFDLIFIANVLGGLDKNKIFFVANFLSNSLNKNGILFLNENTDNNNNNKRVFQYWESRNDKFYIDLFPKINLKKVDTYKYNHMLTSVFVGKRKVLQRMGL
jgi:2-polyprenyl-3-methyl-5-hydroxy-6-metoxy-1,4-benzoquinol methylase